MNSLWLERMSAYRITPLALASAKELLEIKDTRRTHLLKRYHLDIPYDVYDPVETYEAILLCEARNAKTFWKAYSTLLPKWFDTFTRRPHSGDVVNQLLDVGYHHLATMVEKIILEKDISSSLGLIHRAQSSMLLPRRHDSRCACRLPKPIIDTLVQP